MKPLSKKGKSTKLKPLKPNLRIKTRYVLFEILNPKKNIDPIKIIMDACRELYGIIGFSDMDFRKISTKNNKGIIMVNRKSVDKLKASFLLINKKENINLVSRYVSGSLKKIKNMI
jgi:RNase P/RNase MRP subunit POP5